MPSTRKQKVKARKSRELDMLSVYCNMDVTLGDGNSISIEREIDSPINAPERQRDFQSFPNRKNSSSQENEIRDISNRNEPVREERLIKSINILSGEMIARMSREMETMMDFMQTQISRAFSCAISERIIPEIQNMVENLPLTVMALSRIRPQMRMRLVMFGRTEMQNLQRRTQGPLVNLGKIRTLLLTVRYLDQRGQSLSRSCFATKKSFRNCAL